MLAAMSSNFRKYLHQQTPAHQGVAAKEGATYAGEDPMSGMLTPIIHVPTTAPDTAGTVATPEGAAAPAAATAEEAGTAAAAEGAGETAVVAPEPVAQVVQAPPPPSRELELQVHHVGTSEAMSILLGYVYGAGTSAEWEYRPSTAEVNKDILRLARHFDLPHLHEHAARWLAKGLSTANVVERLVTCEEFGLGLLREKIIEQLTANPAELTIVSSSPEIMQHPRILQDLLVAVASLCGVGAGGATASPAAPSPPPPKATASEKEQAQAAPVGEKVPSLQKKADKTQDKEREKENLKEQKVVSAEKEKEKEKDKDKDKEIKGPPIKRSKRGAGA